jgi:uncharacterized membrane protein YdfJ with MMPL/SSD domain
MLARLLPALAAMAMRRPRRVLALAAALTVAAGAYGGTVADRLDPFGDDDPAAESVRADARIAEATGDDPSATVVALLERPRGSGPVRSRAGRRRVARLARELERQPGVARVTTAFDGLGRIAISRDGRRTYLVASLAPGPDKQHEQTADRLLERFEPRPGVALGGEQVMVRQLNEQVKSDLRRAELLVFPLLFVLLFLFYRGLVAAVIPLLLGAMSILLSFAALRIAGELGSVSVFALNVVTGLGLGLAIDYSLFVLSRYREEMARTGPGAEALNATLRTAGRTVLFSAMTVAGALAALLVFPQRFLFSVGLGGVIVALVAAAVALVVLPAMLALLGARVNALAPARLRRAAAADARPASAGFWFRLSRFVMRRPGTIAVAGSLALLLLAAPSLRMDVHPATADVLPAGAGAKAVHEALRTSFPADVTKAVRVVVDTPRPARLARRVARLDRVETVLPARRLDRRTSMIEVIPAGDGAGPGAQALVADIRRLAGERRALVTGESAAFVDLKASIGNHMPLALAIIVLATFVALFLMTGSVVLPVKQLVMNVLSLAATLGILVLIFQDGRFEDLLGFTSQGAIEIHQPILLVAAAFGLSTDYGAFLLGRIKEARDGGRRNREAVPLGLERTGRIVTAAALLFAVAMGSFATSEIVYIKEVGIGIALAVLIDATIVRALLVPSLMALLGRANWWAPAPLRRLHMRIGVAEVAAAPSARLVAAEPDARLGSARVQPREPVA